MSRKSFAVAAVSATLCALVVGASFASVSLAATRGSQVAISVPKKTTPGRPFVVKLTMPDTVAAVDGRVLFAKGAADVWGVAPVGGGTAFRPEAVPGGMAFGAYDLHAAGGQTVVRIVMSSRKSARLQVGVAVDAVSDRGGHRLPLSGGLRISTVGSGGTNVLGVPQVSWDTTPTRAPVPTRDIQPDGRINRQDLDATRIGWGSARADGSVCGGVSAADGDANGDGCVDIVDVQATLAAQGRTITPAATLTADLTLVVNNAGDTPDATPGDGICADAAGQCTLRAAMTESNWVKGNDLIQFNLAGAAPVTITPATRLPNIGSRTGTMTIDGYSQPGSHPNTAASGSNAVPGVEIRGPGVNSHTVGLYITSSGNTIKGLTFRDIYRTIFIDGVDAHDNTIVGNWIGFLKDGNLAGRGQYGILLNSGATNNHIGGSALADRNLVGNEGTAIDNYGAGVNGNFIQGNTLCMRPNGTSVATCNCGIDHNFGSKNDLVGGSNPGEPNIIGPTALQGIEYSHGWNPAGPHGASDPTWENSGNRVIGNWVGFRGDGSYNASFRSGLNSSSADNAQGINIYDGSRNNTIAGNYVASVYDGITLMSGNSYGNVVRNNTIGVSPLGQAAPLTRWGVVARLNTKDHQVIGNTIRNAGLGGIGLIGINNANQPSPVAENILISQNIVTDTSGRAIYLAIDPDDPTTTANHGIKPPVITSATPALVKGTGVKDATVEFYRASRPAGQVGLPTAYLASTTVGQDGNWSINLPVAAGDLITALQSDPNNNSSELAPNIAVGTSTPPPQSGDLLASDAFERTVSGGWGTAVQGGAWSLIGQAADFSVGGGQGRISVAANATREARLAIAAADVNFTGTVSFDRLPGAGNEFAYVVARANDTTSYRTTIRVATNGGVFVKLTRVVNNTQSDVASEVNAGFATTAGGSIGFRFRIVGGHLQFRVWDAASSEPGTWNTEADDATAQLQGQGSVGLRAYAGSTVPNGPVQVSFDALEVRVP